MPLPDFLPLTPTISLYTPPQPSASHLVILCTWMGAADKHINKYTELHKQRIPTARILLLKSKVTSMIAPYTAQQAALEPATAPVLATLAETNAPPKVLLHVFSNGGINSATHLLTVLQRQTHKPLPLVGIICDSVPTGAGYWKTYNAFMHSFPSSLPVSVVAGAVVHTLLILLFLSVAVGRYENPEDMWRRSILHEKLVGTNRISYVASKADKLTDWRDVAAHAEEARSKGWEVREIIYEDSAHCNHLYKDPQAYHRVITDTWEGSKL
jgi:hypothetical protein